MLNHSNALTNDLMDAVNMGQPDSYGIFRIPESRKLCLIYLGRYMYLKQFVLDMRCSDGREFRATENDLTWQIAMDRDVDQSCVARMVIVDQTGEPLLTTSRDKFTGQLWAIAESRSIDRAFTLHSVFGCDAKDGMMHGSILADSEQDLVAHMTLSALYLQPRSAVSGRVSFE